MASDLTFGSGVLLGIAIGVLGVFVVMCIAAWGYGLGKEESNKEQC